VEGPGQLEELLHPGRSGQEKIATETNTKNGRKRTDVVFNNGGKKKRGCRPGAPKAREEYDVDSILGTKRKGLFGNPR